jgi:hypothetical protein
MTVISPQLQVQERMLCELVDPPLSGLATLVAKDTSREEKRKTAYQAIIIFHLSFTKNGYTNIKNISERLLQTNSQKKIYAQDHDALLQSRVLGQSTILNPQRELIAFLPSYLLEKLLLLTTYKYTYLLFPYRRSIFSLVQLYRPSSIPYSCTP